ncbi:MAG: ribosome maturation factor RimP [Clostridiales bacterium]|nr:ribosome maturation factor RimP [Clostridiales bacterium]
MAKKKQGGNTVQSVWKLAQPIAEDLGLEIWDVRFVKEGAEWYLRIFIDKPEGVTIEDCEAMSRAVDHPLDELDAIEQSYCLEVCSPGLERELTRPEHFEKFEGFPVKVRLIRPMSNGEKEFSGLLGGLEDGIVTVTREEGEELSFSKKDAVFVKLDDFDDDFGGIEQ